MRCGRVEGSQAFSRSATMASVSAKPESRVSNGLWPANATFQPSRPLDTVAKTRSLQQISKTGSGPPDSQDSLKVQI